MENKIQTDISTFQMSFYFFSVLQLRPVPPPPPSAALPCSRRLPYAPRRPLLPSTQARTPPRLFLHCQAGGAAAELPGGQRPARPWAWHRGPGRARPEGHCPDLSSLARPAGRPRSRAGEKYRWGAESVGGQAGQQSGCPPARAGRTARPNPRPNRPVPPQMPSFSCELSRFTT